MVKKQIILQLGKKEGNIWTYTFKDVPIFSTIDGHAISYRAEEESVVGYTNVDTEREDTKYELNTNIETVDKITKCSSINFTMSSVTTDLDFIAVQASKGGNNFLIWTARNITDAEKKYIKNILAKKAYSQISSAGIEYVSGFGTHRLQSRGTVTITKDASGKVSLSMSNTSAWATWAHANLPTYEYKIGTAKFTNAATLTSVTVKKTWNDNNNQDGLRPESITVNLKANGNVVNTIKLSEESNWNYTFESLPKYNDGVELTYTVDEARVEGYEKAITGSVSEGFNITNTHSPEKTSVSGTKIWNDNDNQDGLRPASIKVRLYANGTEVASKDVTAANGWAYSFDELDKYADGSEIEYTIKEDNVDNYSTEISGYDITNTHSPEKTSVTGRKVWQDANNQDGVRPASIIVKLYADGTYVTEGVVTEGENKNWAFAFTDLPKYNNGTEIAYTVKEESVDGYTTTYGDNNTIINTHETSKTSVSGTKTWDDNDNQDGLRPVSIKVRLYANGTEVDSKDVTEANGWAYSFDDLDKYAEGTEINYTITEDAVDNYSTEINGYDITNTHSPEKISVSGTKTWDDNNNQDGVRPASIKIRLYANGTEVDSKDVTEANGWAYSFDDLDKYADGSEIEYKITEDTVDGYEKEVTGYNVTNTHVPEKITFKATKVWNDNDNQDGIRPASIKVYLYKNNELFKTAVISDANNWTYSFDELDRYADGSEISYKIVEDTVNGYDTEINYDEIDENNIISSTITNTHTPEKIDIDINKTWDDKDNYDGLRPIEIAVDLYKDGEYYDTYIINENDNWKYSIKDLDKYANGTEILYTILEHPVAYYETIINGFNITNKHEVIEGTGGVVEEIVAPNTGVEESTNGISKVIEIILIILGLSFVSQKVINE